MTQCYKSDTLHFEHVSVPSQINGKQPFFYLFPLMKLFLCIFCQISFFVFLWFLFFLMAVCYVASDEVSNLVVANFTYFDLELLLLVADVLDGDVDDREPRGLRVLQAEDGSCPLFVLMLKSVILCKANATSSQTSMICQTYFNFIFESTVKPELTTTSE